MFLIIVLKELTEVTEGFDAARAVIGELGNMGLGGMTAIGESGSFVHVGTHGSLALSKLIYLTPCIIFSTTTTAIAAFDVLNCVGPRLESNLMANGTGHIARTMHLHVHLQLILMVELAVTGMAFVYVRHAGFAAGAPFALGPLIAAESAARAPLATLGTLASHLAGMFCCYQALIGPMEAGPSSGSVPSTEK